MKNRLYRYLIPGAVLLALLLPLPAMADDDEDDEHSSESSTRFKISEAVWDDEKSRLEVKGKGDKGQSVTVMSTAGRLIGSVKVRDKEWKLVTLLTGDVPCRVSAEQSNGAADEQDIKDTPADCDGGAPPPVASGDFTVLAANDLGMHCADQDYRIFSILPPYNVINAQVLQKGGEPRHMSPADGVHVTYRAVESNIIDPNDPAAGALAIDSINSTSENDNGVYKANFWDPLKNAADPLLGFLSYDNLYPAGVLAAFPLVDPVMGFLLGLPAPDIERLYLGDGMLSAEQSSMPGRHDPYVANDPQPFHGYITDLPFFVEFPFGYEVKDFKRYSAEGLPITPIDDQGRMNPYPLMRIEARDDTGKVLAQNDVVVPVASEADCQSCHLESRVCTGLGLGFKCDDIANYYSDADFIDSGNINTSDETNQHYVPGDTNEQLALNASKINILRLHDAKNGTVLDHERTVVCANCHYSPALDLAHMGPNDENGKQQTRHRSMSNVMHSYHAGLRNGGSKDPENVYSDLFPVMPTFDNRTAEQTQAILEQTCYSCHPGKRTACLRGAMAQGGMVCQDCHGQGTQVGNDFTTPFPGDADLAKRVPWASEPKCQSCHLGDVLQVGNLSATGALDDLLINGSDVWGNPDGLRSLMAYALPEHVDNGGDKQLTLQDFPNSRFASDQPLYRLSGSTGDKGHGDLFCEGCHGGTHAIWPNANPFSNDNKTSMELQGHSGPITECNTCHTGDLGNTLKGPHGMHPVGNTSFSSGGHEEMAERNKNSCRACHGTAGEGTVLSRAAADRILDKDEHGEKIIHVARGTPVSCTLCHENKLN